MPNYIKKLGIQSEPTKAATLYDINSDISTFVTVGNSTSTVTIDENFKYNILTWTERNTSSLAMTIPVMQKNQELYVIFINPLDKNIDITINPASTNATYYTGSVDAGSNGKGTFTIQANSTMEVSIIRLDNVSGSTVSSYYFVRVA